MKETAGDISIKDYFYELPEEQIAFFPKEQRDESRLLVWNNGSITEDIYRNISLHLPPGSLLFFNDTKVVEARLLFQKPTGGIIEIFCLEPHEQYADIAMAMLSREKVLWQCLVGGASKWKPKQVLVKKIKSGSTDFILEARFAEKRPDVFIIELSWSPPELSFVEILHAAGSIPLPPYIKRPAEKNDEERYQTIYAKEEGSVAAPTAGLHFTKDIFSQLAQKNIDINYISLHVGAGTFKPVKTEKIADHAMHAEWIEVKKSAIEKLMAAGSRNIVAVGTTTLRTLESLYFLGLKIMNGSADISELSQWEAYELAKKEVAVPEAMEAMLSWMNKRKQERLIAKTQLIILPGYNFKIVNGLVTNFHLPGSTLLLLVSAFLGDAPNEKHPQWRRIYDYALQNNFRFLSYGDGCLLWRKR